MLLSRVRFLIKYTNLSFGAAGLDQNGEVSDLMRDLVQQDGDRGDSTHGRTDQEGGSDRQPIRKVMGEVGSKVQVT